MSQERITNAEPKATVHASVRLDISLGGVPASTSNEQVAKGLTRMMEEAWQAMFPAIVPARYQGEVISRVPD
jgi:hypothetical protein